MNSFTKSIKEFIYSFMPLDRYFGKSFRVLFQQLLETAKWDRQQHEQQKLQDLQALVSHAECNVQYYRELFKKNDINSRDIKSFADFSKIPVLTKNILRYNLEKLKADNFQTYQPIKTETSGTTGQITTLYRSSYHESFRLAMMWRFYHQQGFSFSDKIATLTSPWGMSANAPLYEYDRLSRKLILNSYHIHNGNCDKILDALANFNPKMIWSHPNILCALSHWMINNNRYPLKIPIIATFGERIYPHVRKILNKAFDSKFIEYYGNRENSVAAWGNSDDHFFEISEYCHIEIDKRATPNSKREIGDLITTSLHNYAVPLIRYNSEDVACDLKYQHNDSYPSFELLGGRGKDLLLSSKGLVVPYTPHIFDTAEINRLKQYQIEQISIDRIIVRIVPSESYDKKRDEALVQKYFSEVVANLFDIKFEYVDYIPFTEGGKYRVTISPLATQYLKNGV